MPTPKERLQEAAHKLAGSAENLEEIICPSPDFSDPFRVRNVNAAPKDSGVSTDNLPEVIKAGLKEVRKYADEIEEIVK